MRLAQTRLYLVCGARPGGRRLAAVLEPALDAGVDIVQLRDKHAGRDELLEAAAVARALCTRAQALFVVNDDPELALAADADGVHLGQSDGAPEAAREIVGPDRIIGLSTHSAAEIECASAAADYIAVGPVHATPTKPGVPPVGLELVRHAAEHAGVPFFAIGGIDRSNIAAVAAAGAERVAVVRAIADAPDPGGAARALRSALEVRVGTT